MGTKVKEYLRDPFLKQLYSEIRQVGAIRSISVDLTHRCNIRCLGCYFFAEEMDIHKSPDDESEFDAFIARELERGTNFVTVVGGEPALALDRLKKVYDHFWMNVATNGMIRIPYEGFEKMPIGISVWGDHATDRHLRGSGKIDVFKRALANYRDDPRAFWYYTVAPGHAHEIESVVRQCIDNGNYVLFNYYCDIQRLGGELDSLSGFGEVQREINRMIEKYPHRIFTTSYLSYVITTGELFGQKWGHEVCTSITPDHPVNAQRILNGNPYNPHFRAYNADFKTTRRCCTGVDRDCSVCFDTWEHFSWIMLNYKRHVHSYQDFTNWLTTMYMFYLINRIVDFDEGVKRLPEIHARVGLYEPPPTRQTKHVVVTLESLVQRRPPVVGHSPHRGRSQVKSGKALLGETPSH